MFSGAGAGTAWDPESAGAVRGPIPAETKRRIHQELTDCLKEPTPGIVIAPDETDILRWHALVIGPDGTPYEGGFFYFVIQCPAEYPFAPPKVTL